MVHRLPKGMDCHISSISDVCNALYGSEAHIDRSYKISDDHLPVELCSYKYLINRNKKWHPCYGCHTKVQYYVSRLSLDLFLFQIDMNISCALSSETLHAYGVWNGPYKVGISLRMPAADSSGSNSMYEGIITGT